MADPESSLRRLVEEGTRASRQPPLSELRRRARRRHTVRRTATAAVVTAAVIAAVPLLGSERSGSSTPGPTAPGTPQSSVTEPTGSSLNASPRQAPAGGTVTLHGTGCAPGAAVSVGIRWERGAPLSLTLKERKAQAQPHTTATAAGTDTLTSVHALPTGSFEAQVTIPAAPAINRPTLWARCETPSPAHQLTQTVMIVVTPA